MSANAVSQMPSDPCIYHITHVDNLDGIVRAGGLFSDSERIARNVPSTNIGHLHIKQRRLSRAVTTRAGGNLGDYVPFNFCTRSVMLYVLSRGHQDYSGGQENIVHLVSKISIATSLRRAWAFTDRHAELGHALYFDDLAKLPEVPWHTMGERYWSEVKEERQAEFLVYGFFPWTAVTEVAVMSQATANLAFQALSSSAHRPLVTQRPDWYY
jgi:hypothetical protein